MLTHLVLHTHQVTTLTHQEAVPLLQAHLLPEPHQPVPQPTSLPTSLFKNPLALTQAIPQVPATHLDLIHLAVSHQEVDTRPLEQGMLSSVVLLRVPGHQEQVTVHMEVLRQLVLSHLVLKRLPVFQLLSRILFVLRQLLRSRDFGTLCC